jgi:hypothetical protein
MQIRLATQTPSSRSKRAIFFGIVCDTITASSACALRWSFFSFVSQRLDQAVVRFDSDVLKDIATELTFTDRLYEIERKLSSQLVLQSELKDLALRLLRALLGFSLKILSCWFN